MVTVSLRQFDDERERSTGLLHCLMQRMRRSERMPIHGYGATQL
jgi:hypothetical protein